MSFAALLSGAWWAQKLSSIGAQALAIAAGVSIACAVSAAGLIWIYNAGARAARAEADKANLRGQIAANARAAQRYVASNKIAEQRARLREIERAADRQRIEDLEALASTNAPPPASDTPIKPGPANGRQCWSPAQIQRMNKL